MAVTATPTIPLMTKDHARGTINSIHKEMALMQSGDENIRILVLDLHQREGWRALGYESWSDCVTKEFPASRSALYRALQAGLIEADLVASGAILSSGVVPTHVLGVLTWLTPEDRPAAYKEASKDRERQPTRKELEEIVRKGRAERAGKPGYDEHGVRISNNPSQLGQTTAYASEGKKKSSGKGVTSKEDDALRRTVVNGILSQDPPDIADARASGKIAEDAIVTVTEPKDPGPEADEEPQTPEEISAARAKMESEIPDDLWLQSLPAYAGLTEGSVSQRIFRRDALLWRALEPARDAFARIARAELEKSRKRSFRVGTIGEFGWKLKMFLQLDAPRHWRVCPPEDKGGCGGTGTKGMLGQCGDCYGRGYTMAEKGEES